MGSDFSFNRNEFAGSLGDLGTILPLAVGMIMINGLSPAGVFLGVALFYIASGLYFRVTCPVEPMKVISAYALATGVSVAQIQASCLWLFLFLAFLGATNLISAIGNIVRTPVIRGVQLTTGLLLITQGIKLMTGSSPIQLLHNAAEPLLPLQSIGPIPIGLLIGGLLALLTLLLLDNRHLPAAIVVVAAGMLISICFGNVNLPALLPSSFFLPSFIPYGIPGYHDFTMALVVLVLPQLPMTVGNAVISNADLTHRYFPETGGRVTYRALCLGMSLANLGSFLFGGIPMCQGAGGLASRYRFGARTAGSNLIIGFLFLVLVLLFGDRILAVIGLIPYSALGVLLIFAGIQLALTLLDIKTRKDLTVPIVIVGITLAFNLAAGFIVGLLLDTLFRWEKITI